MTPSGRLPDLLVIGAPRAGTTALYRYLQEHPEIFMSAWKEPSFFACGEAAVELAGAEAAAADDELLARSVLTWDEYMALFAGARGDQLTGEASPTYLYPDHVAATVAHHVPGARIIVILRQPVERAFSHLVASSGGRGAGAEDLERELAAEDLDPRRTLVGQGDLIRPGLYGRHLERWLGHFGRDQVLVIRHERFDADPAAVMAALFTFLGVDPRFRPDVGVRYNQSGSVAKVSASRAISSLSTRLGTIRRRLPAGAGRRLARIKGRLRSAEVTRLSLDSETRRRLTERYFSEDIEALARLTGDDYGEWLT